MNNDRRKRNKKYWRKPYKQILPSRKTRGCTLNITEEKDMDMEVVVMETTIKRGYK